MDRAEYGVGSSLVLPVEVRFRKKLLVLENIIFVPRARPA